MQQTDFQRFHAVMTGMAKLYERELDNLVLDAYWLALRNWSLSDFESAAGHLMQTSKWMPKPSEFMDLRKAGQPTAAEAWVAAMAACTRWRKGAVSVDDRTDRAVRAIGGYQALALSNLETQIPHMSRRFMEIYDELSDVDSARSALPHVASPQKSVRINHGLQHVSFGMLDMLDDDFVARQ